jgi:hypothetical protein
MADIPGPWCSRETQGTGHVLISNQLWQCNDWDGMLPLEKLGPMRRIAIGRRAEAFPAGAGI